jgi:PTS system nitrogen regulatory IIA component
MDGPDVTIRIADILPIENVLLEVEATSKRGVFEHVGELFSRRYGMDRAQVSNALNAREHLGSTALGHGVALPHARLAGASTAAAFVRTRLPIPFDAPDGKPVSDMIALVVPNGATDLHLRLLADIAQLFGQQEFREKLRSCADPGEVHRLILAHARS